MDASRFERGFDAVGECASGSSGSPSNFESPVSLLWLKEFVKSFLLPPAGPLLLALAGLVVGRRNAVLGLRIALLGVALLWLLAMPAVSGLLVWTLDRSPPLDLDKIDGAQAVVVLSGGTRLYAPEYGGATVGATTLQRVRYAARVARLTGLPILASGGPVRGAPPEALLMRDVLTHEFHLPVRWLETHSRTTHENAVNSAAILKRDGVSRVILVGHSFDFPRSRKEFEAAGMHVLPAPIEMPAVVPTAVDDYLPSAKGMLQSYYACYEILANVVFDVTHAFARPVPAGHQAAAPVT